MLKAFSRIRTGAARAWRAVKQTFTLTSYGGFSSVFSRLTASFGKQSHDRMTEYAARNPIARRAITFIAQNLASIPLQVVRRNADGTTETVEDSALERLLDQPAGPGNYRYGRRWMFDTMVWALMGGGEFWLRGISPTGGSNAGVPRRLRIYDASDFSAFERDPRSNMVEGYHLIDYDNRSRTFDTQEVLHAYLANPTDRDRGLPILLSVMRQLELLEETDEWNLNVSGSKGSVPGFFKPTGLEPGDQISSSDREQAQAQIDEHINNSRASNKWMLLSGSYEPMQQSISPKEAEWLEGSKHYGRLVATGLGIDPTLLGDDEAKTYNNYSTALIIAFTTTILPMLDFILDHLNQWLAPKFGDDLEIIYDRSQIDALDEQMLERVDALKMAVESGIITVDEARQELGRDEMGADELRVPFNVQPGSVFYGSGTDDAPAPVRDVADMSPEEARKAIDDLLEVTPSGDGR